MPACSPGGKSPTSAVVKLWPYLLVLTACADAASGVARGDAASVDAAADGGPRGEDATSLLPDAASPLDAATALDAATGAPDAAGVSPDAATVHPDAAFPDAGTRPVVFVHGIGGNSGEFAVMIADLVAHGWPADDLIALDFPDPRWGCNVDNASLIDAAIDELLTRTGQDRVDLVAHSMGVLSSRYYLKNLNGTSVVNTYVTLGGMHHGNQSACLNPLPVCVWQEICPTRPFLMQLNDPPATPGPSRWVSIFSTDDDRVPVASSRLVGAENIQVSGPVHAGPMGILESPIVLPEVRRVLQYPRW